MRQTIKLQIQSNIGGIHASIKNVWERDDCLIVVSHFKSGPLQLSEEGKITAIRAVELRNSTKELQVKHFVVHGELARSPDENKLFKSINTLVDIANELDKAVCLTAPDAPLLFAPVAPEPVVSVDHSSLMTIFIP
jgi:hypothetical protein